MRVTLAPPGTGDAAAIAAATRSPEVSRWLAGMPWPDAAGEAGAFPPGTAEARDLAIRVDGGFAGMIRCGAELGYWLAPAWQGRGVAARAVELALSRRFAGGAGSCVARVMAGNARSRALLLRTGFRAVARTTLASASLGPVPATVFRVSRAGFAQARPIRVPTPRCALSPPSPADLTVLQAIATRPEVARMLLLFHPGMTAAAFAATHPPFDGAPPFRLAMRHEGRVVGSIGAGPGPRAPIWYFLDPAVAGRGLASEIVPAFCAEIVDRYAPAALTADVFDDNPASARVLERAGFRRDGPRTLASHGRDAPAPAHGYLRETVGPEGLEPPTKAL